MEYFCDVFFAGHVAVMLIVYKNIFDHLSPRLQQVLFEVKQFKDRNNYQYCWAKDSVVYLRRDSKSQPIKIKDLRELQRLARDFRTAETAS